MSSRPSRSRTRSAFAAVRSEVRLPVAAVTARVRSSRDFSARMIARASSMPGSVSIRRFFMCAFPEERYGRYNNQKIQWVASALSALPYERGGPKVSQRLVAVFSHVVTDEVYTADGRPAA